MNLVRDSSGAAMLYRMLVFNLGTVGSIAALIGFAQSMFRERKPGWFLIGISAICFALALALATLV